MNRRNFIRNSSLMGLSSALVKPTLLTETSTKSLIKPRSLPKNGTIKLIAPASALSRSSFEKTLENINALDLQVKYSDDLRVKRGFLSGTDTQRCKDLMDGFEDDNVDAIMCARGGYGTARMLPLIDFDIVKNNPKIFIGFSDITALLMAFYQQVGIVGFHGPVGASDFNDFTKDAFLDIVQKGKKGEIKNDDSPAIVGGLAEGPLVGGNLSLICSQIGTPYDVSFDDHILFIEEVGESTYRIDRMLTQLLNAGKLNNVKGIALGHFTNCDTSPDDPNFEMSVSLDEVFRDRFKGLNIPVMKGLPIGHEENNATIPVGIMAELDADKGKLSFLESAVID